MEVNLFVHLKLFPRTVNITIIDDGRNPGYYSEHNGYLTYCPECKKGIILETVSLEFCGNCGYIQTDYWPTATTNN